MSYEKQNFTDGIVLKAKHLNFIENQVYNNTMAIENGLEIIDAKSANFDMDVIFTSGEHCRIYKTNKDTLNTPYAKGNTTFMSSYILSVTNSATYGKQVAYIMGNGTFERRLNNGVIEDWCKVYNSNDAYSKSEVNKLIQDAIDATWEASY